LKLRLNPAHKEKFMSKQVQEAYIVAATRSPIGKSGRGYFRNTRPDDLLVAVIQSALAPGAHARPQSD
jgi:acetyl-CoA acyltransferase